MTTYLAYARVSTAKQGRSGLGLEAQQSAIDAFLKSGDTLLAPVYVEVESGKRSDRPELAKALAHAKLTGATLLVAKLDCSATFRVRKRDKQDENPAFRDWRRA